MEPSTIGTTAEKHVRHGSGRVSQARRSTRGPLDINDSPLISSPTSPTNSTLLSPTSTPQTRTPRLPSPTPGSNLSYHTTRTSPSFVTATSNLSTNPLTTRDFSALLSPTLYHPLPQSLIPPPFRSSPLQPSPTTALPLLLSAGHFRHAATKAALLLTTPLGPASPSGPDDHPRIFELFYIRLASLTLCSQTAIAAQEVKALEDLSAGTYRDEEGRHIVPWELRVLSVRLQGMGFSDVRRGVVGFYDLAREARLNLTSLKRARSTGPAASPTPPTSESQEGEGDGSDGAINLWTHRLNELGVLVASALVEMGDLSGASRHLSTLDERASPGRTRELATQKALLHLSLGDIDSARSCVSGFNNHNATETIRGLAAMADGEYEVAVGVWDGLLSNPTPSLVTSKESNVNLEENGEEVMYRCNLGVSLLYCGRLDEARTTLSGLIDDTQSFHALTFNLSTIYELCTERSRALKINLAEKVAEMGVGEGEKRGGWEKVNGDFKL